MMNQSMKANRFLKLCEGKKKLSAITNHLKNGKVIMVCTPLRVTQYGKKHIAMFKMDKAGSVYAQRGKKWDCIDYTTIKFSI